MNYSRIWMHDTPIMGASWDLREGSRKQGFALGWMLSGKWDNSVMGYLFIKKIFYFIFRERKWGERKGEKHQCVVAS